VLNKADREGIDRLEQEILGMLGLSMGTIGRPVLKTVATTGEGVQELLAALDGLAKAGSNRRLASGGYLEDFGPMLDHLGIAVRSVAEAAGLYGALGMSVSVTEEIASEKVRVAMLALGESRIELLEATEADSAVGRFLARRGEGLHHIALRVRDLAAAAESMKARGVRLISEEIQVGAGGHRYVFIHPSSANGVLLELVEEAHQ
jgi:LAO/AO transport system kinase